MVIWIAIGIATGTAIGALYDHAAIGLSMGMLLGAAIGYGKSPSRAHKARRYPPKAWLGEL